MHGSLRARQPTCLHTEGRRVERTTPQVQTLQRHVLARHYVSWQCGNGRTSLRSTYVSVSSSKTSVTNAV